MNASLVAQTWTGATNANWGTSTNWSPATVPNSVGAAAVFNDPAANRTVSSNGTFAVGSITFNNNTAFTTLLNNSGSGRSITFDEVGAGPAAITVNGTGNAVTTISATMIWTDSVTITVNDTAVTGASGALTLTGSSLTGGGGLTKEGNGVLTSSSNAKSFTGATLVDAGRLRFTASGVFTNTSSVSVTSGAQVMLEQTGTQSFTLGTSSATIVTLNGAGLPSGGPYAATSSGALRLGPTVNAATDLTTLTNAISLASTSTVDTGGNATLTLSGGVSGNGGLTKTGTGTLALTNTGSYGGATVVSAGTLNAGAANALGGTSGVTVNSGGTLLLSNSGTTDRINNAASVNLSSGGVTARTGGILNTGGLSEGTAPTGAGGAGGVVGALTLTTNTNSGVDFNAPGNTGNTGGSKLVFQNFSLVSGTAITIDHWTGTANTNGSDQLLFATNPGYNLADLANVQFTSDAGTNFALGAQLINFNGYSELVPVPEPSTWAAGILTVLALGWTQRRRLTRASALASQS
ncbi:MAG: autotransporter-associated beta strand repeat-containing protein [Chthoniobacterales bacterium]